MEAIKNAIKKSLKILESNGEGHLPLINRLEILNIIKKPNIINKVFFECFKKVYPIWEQSYPNDSIMIGIIKKIDLYLYYQKGNESDFEKIFNKYYNYFEAIDGLSGLAGMSALYLCSSIANDASLTVHDYEGEDDNAFDWQDWNPDFYASMAFSGGNPFAGEGDVKKRKAFWGWYLECILAITKNSNTPLIILNINEKNIDLNLEPSKRTQSPYLNSINNIISRIIEITIEDMEEQHDTATFTKIEISSCCLKVGNSVDMSYLDDNNDKTLIEFCRYWPDDRQTVLFNNIKEEMYKQNPNEGAWIVSHLLINPDKTFSISFNYEDYDNFPQRAKNPEYLIAEFEAYPRSKEFTPDWWQKILGRKAKYLK